MRNQWIRRLAGGTGLLAVACLAVAGTGSAAEGQLPEGLAEKVIAADIAYLQKELAVKTPEKQVVPSIKATAMLLALAAQNNMAGKDADKMAALRDQALKVAELVSKKDYAGARKAAEALSNPPPAAGGKAPLELHKMHGFELHELMSVFRQYETKTRKLGGRDLEKDVKDIARKKKDADPARVAEIGAQVVLIGQYTLHLPNDEGQAKKKDWDRYTNEMIQIGRDLAATATKGKADPAALQKKVYALDANCNACHGEFRD